MRGRGILVWLSLGVALIVGALPLHVCMPHGEEAGSVQVAGCHGHGHSHGLPSGPRRDATCCEDVPLDRLAPTGGVSVPGAGPAPALAETGERPTSADAAPRERVPVATSAPPRERGLIVLLR